MEAYLKQEMAGYCSTLRSMIEDNERCEKSGTSTEYEVERSKKIYRRLAKLLHPDINPQTDLSAKLTELWGRIQDAYHANDVKSLAELEVLAKKALEELGLGSIQVEIPGLKEKIAELKDEIRGITNTEPYTHGALLADEQAVEEKKAELNKELESYQRYAEELDAVITSMLESGGLSFRWKI